MALWSSCPIRVFSSLSKSLISRFFSLRSALSASISFLSWEMVRRARSWDYLKCASACACIAKLILFLPIAAWSDARVLGIDLRVWWVPASFFSRRKPHPGDVGWWVPSGLTQPDGASRNRRIFWSCSFITKINKVINPTESIHSIIIHYKRINIINKMIIILGPAAITIHLNMLAHL